MTDDIPTPPVPATDDPAVLRELLRQANERLSAVASLETMLTASTTAATAAATTAAAPPEPDVLPTAADAIERLHAGLTDALAELDALRTLLIPLAPLAGAAPPKQVAAPTTAAAIDTIRTDIVIHGVSTPATARAIQRHLAAVPGVVGADVRELVDGLLRVTVTGTAPVGADVLADWEPDRPRDIRAEAPGVLEIELSPAT